MPALRTLRLIRRFRAPSRPRADLLDALKLFITVVVSITALCITAGIIFAEDAAKMFGEGKPGTILSVALLALAGARSTYLGIRLAPRVHAAPWITLGSLLVLAAFDDMFKLHEYLDVAIASALGLDPEGPADSIDDVLVGLYALAAAALFLTVGRSLVLRLHAATIAFALAACAFTVMVVLDAFDVHDTPEETCKILAAALLYAGVTLADNDPLTQRLKRTHQRTDPFEHLPV